MKILVLEDEQRNAMRLIRLLNGIDTTFTIEGPLASIKRDGRVFPIRQGGRPYPCGYPPYRRPEFRGSEIRPGNRPHHIHHRIR